MSLLNQYTLSQSTKSSNTFDGTIADYNRISFKSCCAFGAYPLEFLCVGGLRALWFVYQELIYESSLPEVKVRNALTSPCGGYYDGFVRELFVSVAEVRRLKLDEAHGLVG